MKNSVYFFIPLALFLAGCATSNKVENLESRISALEDKYSVSVQEEAVTADTPTGSETVLATEVTAAFAIPETPTKKDIQSALTNTGLYDGKIDGKFGPKTKKAIEEFQAVNGLKVDGKVGPNTWKKLKVYYTPPEITEAAHSE